jgi:hypothetical protein
MLILRMNLVPYPYRSGGLHQPSIEKPVLLRIRDILVRIRIRGSVPLTNRSNSDQDPPLDPALDPAPDPAILQDCNKKFVSFAY